MLCLTHHLLSFISLKGVGHRHTKDTYLFQSNVAGVQFAKKIRTFSEYWCTFGAFLWLRSAIRDLEFLLKRIQSVHWISFWWAIRSAIRVIRKVRVWNVAVKMDVFILQNRLQNETSKNRAICRQFFGFGIEILL